MTKIKILPGNSHWGHGSYHIPGTVLVTSQVSSSFFIRFYKVDISSIL